MFDAAPLHKLRFFPLTLILKAQNHNSHGLVMIVPERPAMRRVRDRSKPAPAAATRVAERRIAPRRMRPMAANRFARMAVPGMLTPRWWASLASQPVLPPQKRHASRRS